MVSTIDGIGSDAALPLEAIWTSVKDALSRELSPTTFNTWIERLKPCFNESNILSLEAPNHFFRSFIEKTYGRDISQAISRISQSLGLPAELHPIVDFCAPSLGPGKAAEGEEGCRACRAESGQPESGPEKRAEGDLISPPQPCDKHLAFDPRLCFETFVVGTQNSLAYHAAKAVAEDSSLGAGILFITGDPGLGKSHLAQALGQRFLGARHKATVMYLTFEDYTNELVLNINRKTMEEFKRKYREKCDLLMLEEAAFLKDKLHIQQELCYTLDNLINNGKRVVITSTKPLQSISKMDQSLRSRLSSSLLAHIGPPDYETRLGILNKLAQGYKAKFPRQIMEYIAQNVKNDVRQLQSCLYTLNANHALLGKPVTMGMAEEIVQSVSGAEGAMILNRVVKAICAAYDLSVEQLKSKSRRKALAEARALGMYLAKSLTAHTLSDIGAAFGRNHSTATYSIHKTEKALLNDHMLRLKVEHLIREIDKAPRKPK